MKAKQLLLYILIVLASVTHAQDFGPNTKISLLTFGPGNDLYSKFGHSAIRLNDPSQGLDLCYNYGTFDFDTPNFYGKFVRGKLDYILSVDKTALLLRYYKRTGREVIEQDIILDEVAVQRIAAFLIDNYKPENRTYKYDFFYDNCATRLRDIIEDQLGEQMVYKGIAESDRVYRDLLIEKLESVPLVLLGINLILGPNTDKAVDLRGEMFLPSYLMDNLDSYGRYTDGEVLMSSKKLVFPERLEFSDASIFRQPALYVFLLFLFSIYAYWRGVFTGALNVLGVFLFSLSATCGLLFSFMWLATDHQTTYMNLNLFWANPLSIYFLIKMSKKKVPSIVLNTQKVLLLLAFLFLVVLPLIQIGIGRTVLNFIAVPKHIPFQIFVFSLIGMLCIQYARFKPQKK
ncbi:MAG: DUF4105 domain-containing protein [Saprospiraceae bacterium]|nr:DUF4105 domain-containing protein [Saprospiraceae bacterium]